METVYLNMKTSQGVETVDEFTRGENSPSEHKEFRAYINVMVSEYRMSGMLVYKSRKSTKEWRT